MGWGGGMRMQPMKGAQDDVGNIHAAQHRREAREVVYLLAGIGLLSSGNGFRDALQTLGLVLLGLRLVPCKR